MHFGCSGATLTGVPIRIVMESEGSTEVCVELGSSPTTEVNVTLETDDTPNNAQGKLYSTFKHKYFS